MQTQKTARTSGTVRATIARKPSGFILYEGPSLYDGAPVVVIATRSSRNKKTGPMLQTWILRADVDPLAASRTGADFSICGACPHRGTANPGKTSGTADGRGCYVQIGQAPASVWRTYKAGKYPRARIFAGLYFPPAGPGHFPENGAACIGKGETVRIGAYGDPAAVPRDIWARLIKHAAGWTGYSHGHLIPGADALPDLCMVSADTEADARAAWSRGFRTFRIVPAVADVIKGAEVICPATAEGGNRATCADCRLCRGAVAGGRSVAVVAHGAGRKHAAAVAVTRAPADPVPLAA